MRDAPLFPLPFPVPAGAALVSAKTGPMPPGAAGFSVGITVPNCRSQLLLKEF
jgi:hypothetical protein